MNICGQEFDFSLLNANDLDRLEDAIDEMTRDSEAETARCDRENVRLGDRLRAQARVSMRGLDKILGAGASARLGLTQNRAQRRTEKRQKDKKHKPPMSYPGQPVSRSEGFYPQAVPAAKMVERVDKAARRKQLLDELAALENG